MFALSESVFVKVFNLSQGFFLGPSSIPFRSVALVIPLPPEVLPLPEPPPVELPVSPPLTLPPEPPPQSTSCHSKILEG